jgi:hypothetical protein
MKRNAAMLILQLRKSTALLPNNRHFRKTERFVREIVPHRDPALVCECSSQGGHHLVVLVFKL